MASLVSKDRYDREHRDVQFSVGDQVGMKLMQPKDKTVDGTVPIKVGPRFSGPWTVTRVSSPVSYYIEKEQMYPRRVHVSHIRKWFEVKVDQIDEMAPEVEGGRSNDSPPLAAEKAIERDEKSLEENSKPE